MSNQKKKSNRQKDIPKSTKYNSDKTVEIELEKNFFIKTQEHNRARLEKWKLGKRNFS